MTHSLSVTSAETTDATTTSQAMPLSQGRTLAVTPSSLGDVVEIRSAEGELEVRITLTAQGPVLTMNAVRLALRATEQLELTAPTIALHASEAVNVTSNGQATVRATDDVAINGRKIYLNS